MGEKQQTYSSLLRSHSCDTAASEEEPAKSAEIIGSIEGLYSEYFQDYLTRTESRRCSKRPCERLSEYTLEVESHVRRAMMGKVECLLQDGSPQPFLAALHRAAENFIEKLRSAMQHGINTSKLFRIICLNEAYHSLVNATQQINRILQPLSRTALNRLNAFTMRLFYEKVLGTAQELAQYAERTNPNLIIIEFLEIKGKLEEQSPAHKENLALGSSSSEDSDALDVLQRLPVDDLVSFINTLAPRKKNSRKRKKLPRPAPEEDLELNEFSRRLAAATVLCPRLRPAISSAFRAKWDSLVRSYN